MRISDWSSDVCSSDPGVSPSVCQVAPIAALTAIGQATAGRQHRLRPQRSGGPASAKNLWARKAARRGSCWRVRLRARARGAAASSTTIRARKTVGEGKGGAVLVDFGGRRHIQKKKKNT